LKAFGYLFTGALELIPASEHLDKVANLLTDFVDAIDTTVLDSVDLELAEILVDTLDIVTGALLEKKESRVDVSSVISPHLYDFFKMLMRCHGVFQSFKLVGKLEPQNVVDCKKKIVQLMPKLAKLSSDESADFFHTQLPRLIVESFHDQAGLDLSTMALQSINWRLVYGLFDFFDEQILQLELQPWSVYKAMIVKR